MNIIKYIAASIANPTSFIRNQCLTIFSFPDNLKISKVCPVYKYTLFSRSVKVTQYLCVYLMKFSLSIF